MKCCKRFTNAVTSKLIKYCNVKFDEVLQMARQCCNVKSDAVLQTVRQCCNVEPYQLGKTTGAVCYRYSKVFSWTIHTRFLDFCITEIAVEQSSVMFWKTAISINAVIF